MRSITVFMIVGATLLASPHAAGAQSAGPQKFYVTATREKVRAPGASLPDQVLTFSVPVQVPRAVLPAGMYVFRRVSPGVMQVLDPRGSHIYATFPIAPVTKTGVERMGEVRFQRIRDDMPIRLIAWYPPDGIGFHPLYSKSEKAPLYAATTVAAK